MTDDTPTPIPGNMSAHLRGSSSMTATLSATAGMAQLWFHDALVVSRNPDPSARRHEVVFSVLFLEAWLYEWVRDVIAPALPVVIDRDIFPGSVRLKAVRKRWADVMNSLFAFHLATAASTGPDAAGFDKLLGLRNALVHGDTSRQYPVDPPDGKTYGDVVELEPGWAIWVAVEQAEKLLTVTMPEDLGRWPGWLRLR